MHIAINLLVIALLILASAFFSMSEISLAAARRLRLKQLMDEGSKKARAVMDLQDSPGYFFTVVQIGLNAVAILGGIVGEAALAPAFGRLLGSVPGLSAAEALASVLSFVVVTGLFILFADLVPKRVGMSNPEAMAMATVGPMKALMMLLAPFVWVFNGLANGMLRLLRIPLVRKDVITPEDIMALADAGAQAGVLLNQEQHLIANVFDLDTRTVGSAMTLRDDIAFLTLGETEEQLRRTIASNPHGKYPVCDSHSIDSVIGYVDSKDLLPRIVEGKKLSLRTEPIVRKILVVPDSLSLFEALERFRDAREDLAVIVNEYAMVVGLITLQDVMSTVMGELVSPFQEELIVARDGASWLIDGITPIEDIMQALGIAEFEGSEQYDTMAGFLMYKLRRVPKRTDFVEYAGFKFEVVDIDNYRIDQVLVTLHEEQSAKPEP